MILTYADAIEHAIDFIGGSPSAASVRDARRAVLQAYRDLVNSHRWTYLYHRGRLYIDGPYSTGTIVYDHAGGTYEREITLSGGTWPDWAGDGYIQVGEVSYKVDQRKSATVLTLDASINPGEDVAAGTAFQLFRDSYLLPEDFVAQDEALYRDWFGAMQYIHPRDWLYSQHSVENQGTPHSFTVTGDPKYPGRMVVRFAPWPDEDGVAVDYLYQRRPRDPRVQELKTGTVSITASSTTLTCSSSVFTDQHLGSVVRIAGTTTALPTSHVGDNPPELESIARSRTSATELELSDAASSTYSGAKYTLSDPIDIEVGAMLNAFLRGVEHQMSIGRKMKDRSSVRDAYFYELRKAKEADSRSFSGRFAGDAFTYHGKRPLWSQPNRVYDA